MLFSLHSTNSKYKQADEIICQYNQLGNIYKFIKKSPDKRINISFPADGDQDKLLQQLIYIKDVSVNYTIACKTQAQMRALIALNEPAYLDYPITDWETFNSLIKCGVSDIWIDGTLGFQMENIARAKKKHAVKIRVSPRLSLNAAFSADNNCTSFYIRPEDLTKYEPYIDIIDFQTADIEQEETVFKIYKRGSFDFNLRELVINLNADAANPLIGEPFGEYRLNCGQVCESPDHSCHICEKYFMQSNLLKKAAAFSASIDKS